MSDKLPVPSKTESLDAVKPSGLKASEGDVARRDEDNKTEEKLRQVYLGAEAELWRLLRAHAGGSASSIEIMKARLAVSEAWSDYLAKKRDGEKKAKRLKKSADVTFEWDDEVIEIEALSPGGATLGEFADVLEKAVKNLKKTATDGKVGDPNFFLSKHLRGLYILYLKKGLEYVLTIRGIIEKHLRGINVDSKFSTKNLLRFPLEKAIKPLTSKEVQALVDEVMDNTYAFAVNFSGAEIDKATAKRLTKQGLIKKDAFSFPANAYAIQRVTNVLESAGKATDALSFPKMLAMARKVPLTPFEKNQIGYLERMASSRVTGLGESIAASLRGTAEHGSQIQQYRKLITQTAKESVINRWGWGNLSSELGRRTQDWSRDWDRIARSELQNANLDSTAVQIATENEGTDPLVYKLPRNDACKYCLELYTRDGNPANPRIFHLSTLIANGTNIGRKAADMKPTKDIAHPNCNCELFEFVGEVAGVTGTNEYGDIAAEEYELYGRVKSNKKNAKLAEELLKVKVTIDGVNLKDLR